MAGTALVGSCMGTLPKCTKVSKEGGKKMCPGQAEVIVVLVNCLGGIAAGLMGRCAGDVSAGRDLYA